MGWGSVGAKFGRWASGWLAPGPRVGCLGWRFCPPAARNPSRGCAAAGPLGQLGKLEGLPAGAPAALLGRLRPGGRGAARIRAWNQGAGAAGQGPSETHRPGAALKVCRVLGQQAPRGSRDPSFQPRSRRPALLRPARPGPARRRPGGPAPQLRGAGPPTRAGKGALRPRLERRAPGTRAGGQERPRARVSPGPFRDARRGPGRALGRRRAAGAALAGARCTLLPAPPPRAGPSPRGPPGSVPAPSVLAAPPLSSAGARGRTMGQRGKSE